MGEFKDAGALSYKDQMGKEHPWGAICSRHGDYNQVAMNPNTGRYKSERYPKFPPKTPDTGGMANQGFGDTRNRAGSSPPVQNMLKRLIKLQKAHRKARPEEGRRTGKDAYLRQPRPEDPAGDKRQLRWGMEPDPITGELEGRLRQKHDAETKSAIAGLTPLSEIQTDAEKKAQAQQARMAQWAAEAAAEEIPKGRTKGKKSN